MATLTSTSKSVLGPFNPTKTILSASDILPYVSGQNAELILYNTTAGIINITLDGSSVTTVPVLGAGATTADLSAGLLIAVPANGYTVVRLDTCSSYCVGNISLTGGTGVIACIIY